jgi:hypothetical protein
MVFVNSKHLGSHDVVWKLGPDASFEFKVSLLTHGALNHRLNDGVALFEDSVVIESR